MFVESNIFHFDNHWSYYSYLARYLGLSPRRIKSELWDRFPSDAWIPIEKYLLLPCTVMTILFSLVFLGAWNFFFATNVEQTLWRVASVYHAWFSIVGGAYYFITVLLWHRGRGKASRNSPETTTTPIQTAREPESTGTLIVESTQPSKAPKSLKVDPESLQASQIRQGQWKLVARIARFYRSFVGRVISWRNLSPDGDPNMTLRLRLAIPFAVTSSLYVLCRLYIYVEDFSSLREQPVGIYITVNRFVPFMGN